MLILLTLKENAAINKCWQNIFNNILERAYILVKSQLNKIQILYKDYERNIKKNPTCIDSEWIEIHKN